MFNQSIFLEIMNHFIHPESHPAAVEQLSAGDLEEMLDFAHVHSVFPVVYEAVSGCPDFEALPQQEQLRARQTMKQLVIGQTARTSLFLGYYQHLVRGGVTPLVVKGIVLRNLYAQPDYRSSSDEDLLVRREEFFRLDEILTGLEFDRELGEDPLQEHEITYWHRRNGMHLEIHLTLFPEDSGAYGYLNRAFDGVFDRQIVEQILGVEIHTLSCTDHMLYLICHGLKHFLHSGFGIRQVCDMVKFAECRGSQIDWEHVTGWLREHGLYVFWRNLFDIGEKHLGFSWEQAGLERPRDVEPDSDAMLADLMDSGIYGKRTAERLHSANMTLEAAAGGADRKSLHRTLFPDRAYLQTRYPYLQRRGWLLPVAWIQRAAGYLRRTGRKEIAATVSTGSRRVELLRQYGLIGDHTK